MVMVQGHCQQLQFMPQPRDAYRDWRVCFRFCLAVFHGFLLAGKLLHCLMNLISYYLAI